VKITIESTTKIVEVKSVAGGTPVPARIWEGTTDSGIAVVCYVTRIQVAADERLAEFERELQEQRAPSPVAHAIPLRLIL
jgi:hypothetical protein